MARQLSDTKLKELNFIRDWCGVVLEFMAQKNPLYKDVFLQSKRILEDTYSKRNVTGLKQLHADIKQWAGGLKKSEKEELDTILVAKQEPTLSDEKSIDLERIDKIVQIGVIKTEEEYELVESRANELSQDISAKEEDMEILNRLLITYHTI